MRVNFIPQNKSCHEEISLGEYIRYCVPIMPTKDIICGLLTELVNNRTISTENLVEILDSSDDSPVFVREKCDQL